MSNNRSFRRQQAKAADKDPITEYRDKVSKYADVEVKIVGGAIVIHTRSKLRSDDPADKGGPHGAN